MAGPLAGNRTVQENLAAMLASACLPHAILIEGEAGLGKRTLAAYIAQAAVCEGEVRPCGQCRSCHLARVGSHPDILLTAPEDKKKTISVAQVRQVRQEAYLKPHMAARRVFLFEQAETLNEQAQNALLKILEEPPADALFLLVAASGQALLETIRSRCVTFSLAPPTRDEAFCVLKASQKKPDQELFAALEATGNNIGRALDFLRQKKARQTDELAERFLAQIASGTSLDLLLTVQPLQKDRAGAAAFLDELQLCIVRALRDSFDEKEVALSKEALLRLSDAVREASSYLPRNVNLPLLFSYLCARSKHCLS